MLYFKSPAVILGQHVIVYIFADSDYMESYVLFVYMDQSDGERDNLEFRTQISLGATYNHYNSKTLYAHTITSRVDYFNFRLWSSHMLMSFYSITLL